MKSRLTIILTFISFIAIAQERCATTIYTQLLKDKYPDYAIERDKVNEQTKKWIKNNQVSMSQAIITIPVVVHVVWNTNAENISDAQIFSQIDVLNDDFRRTNSDASNTPNVWQSIAADCEIEFCLASIDPDGNPTTGITRTQTSQTSFSISSSNMKSNSSGGIDPWDQDNYLNIWVCDLTGGILGYATPPSNFNNPEDGVVIRYKYFGTIGQAQSPYDKGRTTTHEVGHWLNLSHVWGDSNCGNDQCADTPTQQSSNYGCPNFPSTSNCSGNGNNGDMFMNYMDYTNDACMNLFTNDQKSRMIAAINQYRPDLLNHNLCSGGTTPNSWDCINGSCVDPGTGNGSYSSYNACVNACNCIGSSLPFYEGFQNISLPTNWSIVNNDNDKTWEITSLAGYNSNASIYVNNADYPANGEIDDLILPTLDLSSSISVDLSFDYAYALWTDPNANPNYSDTLQIWASSDCGSTWQKIWEEEGTDLVTTTPIFTGAAWTPSGNNDWQSEVVNLNNYINQQDFVLKFRNITDYENNIFIDNINITGNMISQSWDCVGGACIDPGTGNGLYTTQAICQAACNVTPTWDCDGQGNCFDPGTGNGQYLSLSDCNNECITTSIVQRDDYLSIYPNPTNMDFTIEFEHSNISEIRVSVYNMQGSEVFLKEIVNFPGYFKQEISLENYAEGVYIVNITSNIGSFYTNRIAYLR